MLLIPAPMLTAVRDLYESPPRAYHSWHHVEDVKRHYDEVGSSGPGWQQPDEVLLAVLLHDAVYVAGAHDNEERSARLVPALIEEHLPHVAVDAGRVADLIRLTARHGSLSPDQVDPDAALFLDCDMAILGAAPDAYDRYEAAIAEEFAALPAEAYRAGRRAFLEHLLKAPRIFLSDHFHARLDAAARDNLRQAVRTLAA
jgi:predicted metal-dependent HD superfamily phosphohydrolase